VLLSDDSLRALLPPFLDDVTLLLQKVSVARKWSGFSMRDVDFPNLDEYRELDDDVPDNDLIFYSVDRRMMERLKRRLGIRRIDRDPAYPGLTFFTIATPEKSTIGYIHAAKGAALPQITRDEFIDLRPVVPGWWVFRRKG
jgi:hypothetical protein